MIAVYQQVLQHERGKMLALMGSTTSGSVNAWMSGLGITCVHPGMSRKAAFPLRTASCTEDAIAYTERAIRRTRRTVHHVHTMLQRTCSSSETSRQGLITSPALLGPEIGWLWGSHTSGVRRERVGCSDLVKKYRVATRVSCCKYARRERSIDDLKP